MPIVVFRCFRPCRSLEEVDPGEPLNEAERISQMPKILEGLSEASIGWDERYVSVAKQNTTLPSAEGRRDRDRRSSKSSTSEQVSGAVSLSRRRERRLACTLRAFKTSKELSNHLRPGRLGLAKPVDASFLMSAGGFADSCSSASIELSVISAGSELSICRSQKFQHPSDHNL